VERRGNVVSTTVMNPSTILAVLAVVLFLFALLQFVAGNLLVAGVTMLGVSLTIFYRETRL
jgi:1,4-dihydroxy-2-naphthoate octaprenyltransferase